MTDPKPAPAAPERSVERDTSTPENRAYWDRIDADARNARRTPDWKRDNLNGETERKLDALLPDVANMPMEEVNSLLKEAKLAPCPACLGAPVEHIQPWCKPAASETETDLDLYVKKWGEMPKPLTLEPEPVRMHRFRGETWKPCSFGVKPSLPRFERHMTVEGIEHADFVPAEALAAARRAEREAREEAEKADERAFKIVGGLIAEKDALKHQVETAKERWALMVEAAENKIATIAALKGELEKAREAGYARAVEDAAKVACPYCRLGKAMYCTDPGSSARYHEYAKNGNPKSRCSAVAIRALGENKP